MTLMEVLIAMMLLAVVAVVIFSAFSIGLRAAALAGGMNTATGIAEETLALLTASPCGSSFTLPISETPDDERLARYHREVRVRPASGVGLWELSVTVSWTQARMQRSVTLTTLRHVSAACAYTGQ
jgi:hypothetical protein